MFHKRKLLRKAEWALYKWCYVAWYDRLRNRVPPFLIYYFTPTMGVVKNITSDSWPKQGSCMHKAVSVCFHYDLSNQIDGLIVRDDAEAPFVTIIALKDGRYVLASECQYSLK